MPARYRRHERDTADPSEVGRLSFELRTRVQTFPKDFKWSGAKTAREQMNANAVPVELARFIGVAIRDYAEARVDRSLRPRRTAP
jgi:DNA (cytosine-5)-methyltransferase 1